MQQATSAAPTTLAAAATQGSWAPALVVVSVAPTISAAAATLAVAPPTLAVVWVAPMTLVAVATVVRLVVEVPVLELDEGVSVEPTTWAVLVTAVRCDSLLLHTMPSWSCLHDCCCE